MGDRLGACEPAGEDALHSPFGLLTSPHRHPSAPPFALQPVAADIKLDPILEPTTYSATQLIGIPFCLWCLWIQHRFGALSAAPTPPIGEAS